MHHSTYQLHLVGQQIQFQSKEIRDSKSESVTDISFFILKFRLFFYVIYEQRERVFHRDIQTGEKMYENTSAKRECFHTLFSSVWMSW
jgi:hypothetical protein